MLYYFWPTIQFLSMANTFSCLNIHCVFSTKERVWVLNPDIRERLWPYMGGIAKQNGMIPKCIGGVSDHVHLLVTLPTRLAVAKAVQLIKAGSSAWIHQTFPNLRNFAWQQGYGVFSVGISQVRSITLNSSSNIIGHEPFKKSI
jgi:putative transposase